MTFYTQLTACFSRKPLDRSVTKFETTKRHQMLKEFNQFNKAKPLLCVAKRSFAFAKRSLTKTSFSKQRVIKC